MLGHMIVEASVVDMKLPRSAATDLSGATRRASASANVLRRVRSRGTSCSLAA